jgi:hypothetical protein
LNAARSYDLKNKNLATAVTHADDLNASLYGVKTGSISETRYSVTSDDTNIANFCMDRHLRCITANRTTASGITAGAAIIHNALVISQLTNVVSIQNKEAMELNNLCHKEIEKQMECKEKKKDRTKKIHPAIMSMLQCSTVTKKNNEREDIAPTCLQFINSKNVGLAQYKLTNQFKERGFPDIAFALGITQVFFLG